MDGWKGDRGREVCARVRSVRKSFGRRNDKSLNDIEWLESRIMRIIKNLKNHSNSYDGVDRYWWAMMGCWFLGLKLQQKKNSSTDSHRRRQTFGPKPSGDCSFGSLAADYFFGGGKNPRSFAMFFHMFYHVFHVCFASPLLAYACFFVDMFFSWFFHSLYNFLPWLLQSMFLQLVTLVIAETSISAISPAVARPSRCPWSH